MKTFDSLVYSMMTKVLDKGVPLNIYLPHGQAMVRDEEVKGEVFSVQWWSTEGILNIQYQFRDEGGNLRTRDYRVRPVSGKMFDDTYTLKKVDGVLTLVRRPKEELEEELDDSTEPLWSSMLRKLLNADKDVHFSSEKKGHRGDRAVYGVEFSRMPSGRPMVEVEHTNSSAIPASIFFVGNKVQNVELKKIDGQWWLIDNNAYDDEAY